MDATAPAPRHRTWMRVQQAVVVVITAVLVAGVVAVGAGTGSVSALGVPVPIWVAAVAFAINWLAFVPAYLRRTERFYDLVGSVTFLATIGLAVALSGHTDARALVPAALVGVWAIRLGMFLFRRVHQDGGDGRFDEIKHSAPRFFVAWTMQALWACVTASAAVASITARARPNVDVTFVIGAVVWTVGFVVEVEADRQKRAFKKDPRGERFIRTGLWAWSRHPNYFGEIVLWLGVWCLSWSTLGGASFVVVLSPLLVIVLLTRISGIPLLETRADARFGDDVEYQRYKATTPVLIPRRPQSSSPSSS
jgi:steroid 5-alpha reductase family enzyme